jgi:preprotein translocase subunit SecB
MQKTPALTSQVKLAALQLDGYYVRALSISVRPGLDDATRFVLSAGLNIQPAQAMEASPPFPDMLTNMSKHTSAPHKYRLIFQVKSPEKEDEKVPYVYNLELVGFLTVLRKKLTGEEEEFVLQNATMILYSTAREILAAATSRGPFPALLLPTVNFTIPTLANPQPKQTPATDTKKLTLAEKKQTGKKSSAKSGKIKS